MAFYTKVKWVLGILMVFVLIVTTNLIDRTNFIRVKESVETIYKDRLVAKGLIFDISTSIQEKEIAVALLDSSFFRVSNSKLNTDINTFISKFESTKLTLKEEKIFQELKDNLIVLEAAEKDFINSKFVNSKATFLKISKVKQNLKDLSEIQIAEGSRQMSISKKAIDTVELFTQIEIYLLVFLAIVIQIIVMYNPKDKD